MYATSHRVQNRPRQGINAFLHEHGPRFAWPSEPAELIGLPEKRPGRIVGRLVALPPGGNPVLSYLDVLAPDGTRWRTLAAALTRLGHELPEMPNPCAFCSGRVFIRFGVELALEDHRKAELHALGSRMRQLFRETRAR